VRLNFNTGTCLLEVYHPMMETLRYSTTHGYCSVGTIFFLIEGEEESENKAKKCVGSKVKCFYSEVAAFGEI
jgi:hypothetical protein